MGFNSGLKGLIVSPGFFCFLVYGRLLSCTIHYQALSLHVANISFCIPTFCSKLELYLFLVPSLCQFCSLSKCVLLFFPYNSSLLLLFFFRLLFLMVLFSLPCDRAGWASVLYSSVLGFFKNFLLFKHTINNACYCHIVIQFVNNVYAFL